MITNYKMTDFEICKTVISRMPDMIKIKLLGRELYIDTVEKLSVNDIKKIKWYEHSPDRDKIEGSFLQNDVVCMLKLCTIHNDKRKTKNKNRNVLFDLLFDADSYISNNDADTLLDKKIKEYERKKGNINQPQKKPPQIKAENEKPKISTTLDKIKQQPQPQLEPEPEEESSSDDIYDHLSTALEDSAKALRRYEKLKDKLLEQQKTIDKILESMIKIADDQEEIKIKQKYLEEKISQDQPKLPKEDYGIDKLESINDRIQKNSEEIMKTNGRMYDLSGKTTDIIHRITNLESNYNHTKQNSFTTNLIDL